MPCKKLYNKFHLVTPIGFDKMHCFFVIFYLTTIIFCAFADEKSLEDAFPGGVLSNLTGMPLHSPTTFGWQVGTCHFDGENSTIDISKIATGYWFLAHHDYLGRLDTKPFVEPFSVIFNASLCTFVHISYDPKGEMLLMRYRCRDNYTEDFRFKKCQYYVRFTSDRHIMYEVAHGCDLEMQLKRVVVSNTDYKNYIIIRGCIVKGGFEGVLYEKYFLMVLVKREGDPKLIKEVENLILSIGIKMTDLATFWNVNKSRSGCDCRKSTCVSVKAVCMPMEILSFRQRFFSKLSHYVIFLASLLIIVIIVVTYEGLKHMNRLNKVRPVSAIST